MRSLPALKSLVALAACAALPVFASASGVVISQVYGGNGVAFNADYVELFNAGSAPVALDGWSVQYASATGTGNFAGNGVTTLSGSLQPGQYALVRLATASGGAALPTPDFTSPTTGSPNLSGTAGKVILASVATGLACNGGSTACNATQLGQIVDLVGYGTANFYEGAAAPAATSSTALFRANDGCSDTGSNAADFATGTPAPRNKASAIKLCSSTPPIVPVCPASATVAQGAEVPLALTASDADSRVNAATLVSVTPAAGGITLGTLAPAAAEGDSASVTLTVGATTAVGTYAALVEFANDDAQTARCTVSITVGGSSGSVTPIPQIQGSGARSPLEGQTVTTRGVVTRLTNVGYFLQDATGDGNPATSDGLFVYVGGAPTVLVGQAIEVTGVVSEFNTGSAGNALTLANPLTELTQTRNLVITGSGSIAPTVVTLPQAVDGELERVEGMLVRIETPLTVTQNYFLGRYGQLTLSAAGRLYTPTGRYRPGTPEALAEASLNARASLLLDDGSSGQNPNPIPYIGADNTVRAGDTLPSLTGVIDYGLATASSDGLADWRLHPTESVLITRANPRSATAPAVGGNVRVASFNVLNYFNGNGAGGGFPTSRGASSAAEFTRQRDKILAAMAAINADVFGLMEIENDGTGASSAIADLVSGLNARVGAGTYAIVPAPASGTGSDEIKVALIYKPAVLDLVGAGLSDTAAIHNRPPVAQGFALKHTTEKFSVVVNHFKSKGCSDASGADTDQGDGQGCYNARRVQQASALLGFIATVKAAVGDDDVLVIGDLNAYGQEDPIHTLAQAGFANQETRFNPDAYSYVFDGQSGSLDHALANATLAAQITDAATWHINADEPSVIDYNTEFKPQDLYSATPYRSSDHDPIIVGIQLATPQPQSISFPPLGTQSVGGTLALAATASSGLPVSYTSLTPATCTVSGNTATLLAVGACRIAADQAGGSGYLAATQVARAFEIGAAQLISFDPLPNRTLLESPVVLAATASSGLPVSYATLTPAVCSVSGTSLTLLATGTCSIEARQAGDSTWGPATPVAQSFTVTTGSGGGTPGSDGDVPLPAWALALLGAALVAGVRRRVG